MSDKCMKNVDKPKQKYADRGLPICNKSEVNVTDVGLYYKDIRKLSDSEICNLMVNHWKASKSLDFPLTTESAGKKQFLHSYPEEFSWLAYPKYLDGCFCIPCLLFGFLGDRLVIVIWPACSLSYTPSRPVHAHDLKIMNDALLFTKILFLSWRIFIKG